MKERGRKGKRGKKEEKKEGKKLIISVAKSVFIIEIIMDCIGGKLLNEMIPVIFIRVYEMGTPYLPLCFMRTLRWSA